MQSDNLGTEPAIQLGVVVDAAREQVFEAWTTDAGVRSFFAPDSRIEAETGGAYELYFMEEGKVPLGQRGSEGCVFLALQAPVFFSASWNAPPHLAAVRNEHSIVIVRFAALSPTQTRVDLTHVGWGEGGQWDEALAYFRRAWGAMVLPRLRHRFAVGPIDWAAPPELASID